MSYCEEAKAKNARQHVRGAKRARGARQHVRQRARGARGARQHVRQRAKRARGARRAKVTSALNAPNDIIDVFA